MNSIAFICLAQLITTIVLFAYFRNKMKKNLRSIYDQFQHGREKSDVKITKIIQKNNTFLQKKITKLEEPIFSQEIKPQLTPTPPIPSQLFAILTLPKVGGSTIANTIEHSFPSSTVCHWHTNSLNAMQRFADLADNSSDNWFKQNSLDLLSKAVYFRSIVKQKNWGDKIFIAGVRDPIALGISLFFQQNLFDNSQSQNFSLAQIQSAIESSEGLWVDLNKLDQWFTEELAPASGHDVFAESFTPEKGYKIYHGGNSDLCVYRLENMAAVLDAVAEVTKVPKFMLKPQKINFTKKGNFSKKYNEVLKEIRFSSTFIDTIYQTKYAIHFYSDSELKEFRSRWSK